MSNLEKYDFHGDQLALLRKDAGGFVVVRTVCDALGIAAAPQRTKLAAKPWAVCTMIVSTAADGKRYEMLAIHVDSLAMWLATIESSKVAEHVRAKLLRFQLECARVLRDHFFGPPPSAPAAPPPAPTLQARISDDSRARATVHTLCQIAAKMSGLSIHAIQGKIRKPWGVNSIYRIALTSLDHTIAELRAIIEAPRARQLPADRRQVAMPWAKN